MKYLSLSFLLHTTILCAVFLPFYFYHQQIGNTQSIKINFQTNAFLFQKQNISHQSKNGNIKILQQKNTIQNQTLAGRESKLLFYLHDAIQKNLIRLNTQANKNIQLNVTLAFTLLPNGKILNAHLIKPTNNPKIDSNILQTIKLIGIMPAKIRPKQQLELEVAVKS